jgi:hypothetical protein
VGIKKGTKLSKGGSSRTVLRELGRLYAPEEMREIEKLRLLRKKWGVTEKIVQLGIRALKKINAHPDIGQLGEIPEKPINVANLVRGEHESIHRYLHGRNISAETFAKLPLKRMEMKQPKHDMYYAEVKNLDGDTVPIFLSPFERATRVLPDATDRRQLKELFRYVGALLARGGVRVSTHDTTLASGIVRPYSAYTIQRTKIHGDEWDEHVKELHARLFGSDFTEQDFTAEPRLAPFKSDGFPVHRNAVTSTAIGEYLTKVMGLSIGGKGAFQGFHPTVTRLLETDGELRREFLRGVISSAFNPKADKGTHGFRLEMFNPNKDFRRFIADLLHLEGITSLQSDKDPAIRISTDSNLKALELCESPRLLTKALLFSSRKDAAKKGYRELTEDAVTAALNNELNPQLLELRVYKRHFPKLVVYLKKIKAGELKRY